MSQTSSFDEEYEDHNDNNLSLINFGSVKQANGYFDPTIMCSKMHTSPSGSLDLELTLGAPNQMDQSQSSTTSLQLGPIISVI